MDSLEEPTRRSGIDYERLYSFRFRRMDQASRRVVWNEIALRIYEWLGRPERILDPAAGRGEFVNAVPSPDRWVVDIIDRFDSHLDPAIKVVIGDARYVELPTGYFDGVFVSNLLEHFPSQEDVGTSLSHMRESMAPQARIAVLGPNFRYCMRDYFDCADHTLAFTHEAIEEHLYAAGFDIVRVVPRFLPYSFRGRLPRAAPLVRAYLRCPPA